MSLRIVKWSTRTNVAGVNTFLKRPAFDPHAEEIAGRVLTDIRKRGNKAVQEYVKRYDGADLRIADFKVAKREIANARRKVDADCVHAIKESCKRVTAFARAGMKKDWRISSPRGGMLGEQFTPLDRVGIYVPGGAAPLVSTVLMTVTMARVAGVPEIVACTPCDKDGKVKPELLYALDVAGATEVYKVGGIQAIGMMAYGTRTISKVRKIVGPGGSFVTAAKRLVYGDVALDLVAGPSEIAILADDTAHPEYIAADLLSQAEHGTGFEKALLVTTSMQIAKAVKEQVELQAETLSRREAIARIMERGMLLVAVPNLDEGMELCNRFAPEHFELMVREPRNWLKKVKSAGAVFVGAWSPESVGDFVAGPSHVLPTGGAAAMFSGLTVDDFMRRTSVIAFTRADLYDTLPVIETFGKIEGLDAHARSASIRFEKK